MTQRQRAIAVKGSSTAKQRQIIFAAGSKRIKSAIEERYYIEAICLLESWIGDRLESHLSYVTRTEHGFSTLERLIKRFISTEGVDLELKNIVLDEVADWKNHRNRAAHELMKIEKDTFETWEQRLERNRKPAEDGLVLLRKIDRRITKMRKES
jgi:hypothetical protein